MATERHTALPATDSARAPCAAPLTAATTLLALLAGVVLVLAGCATPREAASAATLVDARVLGATAVATPWPEARWWRVWQQPELDRLVEQALSGQPSLRLAQARVRQAEAATHAQDAARRPQLTASIDLTDQRFSENGMVPPQLAGATRWSNNAQLGAGWELDLSGRQRAALDAAIGRQRAAQADEQAARVLLASRVAAGYINLARLVDAGAVARQALQQREQIVALVRQRISAGLDTTVDLRQAEGLIAQAQVEIEAIDEAVRLARHGLAELAGQPVQSLDALAPTLMPVPTLPLPDALPADLMGRRADLVAQRWRVEAALRDSDQARTLFYPNVNLMAFVGLSSIGLDRFFQAGSLTYGIGPALRLPLFDSGRLQANLDSQRAEVDAAIEGYNGALQRALREVADELTTLRSLQRQQRAQDDATRAADAAYALGLQRYQAGLGNFLVVLTAQNNVLAQRRAGIDLKARHLTSEVALRRALGGGYEADAQAAPAVAAAR